ncbi:RHS repeat domain-containing protein [Sorangium sp. So ce118]
MARTAPVPNIPAIPGMNPGVFIMGGGDGSGGGRRIESITDAAGRVVRVRRTPDGRIGALEIKNAPEQGRWVALRTYTYDERGVLVADTDAEGCVSRYTYEDHRLTSRTDP